MSQVSFEPEAQFLLFDRVHKVLSFKRAQVDEQPLSAKLELIDAEGIRTEKSLDYLLDQYAKRNVRPVHADLLPPAQRARSTKKVYPLAQDIAADDLARGEARKKLLAAVHKAGGLGWGSVEFWEKDYPRVAKECGFDEEPPGRQTVKRWQRKVIMRRRSALGGRLGGRPQQPRRAGPAAHY
ncbi:hypothetical protein ACPWT1_03970 [Ramlibacter sp. MMS24-I3-19]|uniref:hypothetical protein n=1 Tax=Ramlibacter sp. MMS24-I3-19 TaxID=3416606 RepID=UPI003CFC010B